MTAYANDRWGVPIADRVLRRGIDTSVGQAGHCEECDITMPDGPDACLGYIAGVSHACCGHGDTAKAYVVIGGEPDEPVFGRPHATLYEDEAYDWMEEALS